MTDSVALRLGLVVALVVCVGLVVIVGSRMRG